jgi:hypothetical protein
MVGKNSGAVMVLMLVPELVLGTETSIRCNLATSQTGQVLEMVSHLLKPGKEKELTR